MIGCSLFSIAVSAQNTPATAKVVVYKWTQNGVTHYSTQPPRTLGNVVKLDERGLIIHDEDDIMATANVLRPMRPDQNNNLSSVLDDDQADHHDSENEVLPEGAIPKSERCANAQQDIQTIESAESGRSITVEDAEGNLVPISDEEKNARLQSAKALVERLCNE
ncbi:DUF4124 domain-containing protein [Cardiobacteriaceae bacterium TAE3-ERU3]|nr:DUF4124 domain-containing protein [Cardiobacteriaceae bacterium TAE3-ERU3]